jgi:hypothetical protein
MASSLCSLLRICEQLAQMGVVCLFVLAGSIRMVAAACGTGPTLTLGPENVVAGVR